MANQFAEPAPGARMPSGPGSPLPVADLKALARRVRFVSGVVIFGWVALGAALFPLARHLARDGGLTNGAVAIVVGFYAISVAGMSFVLGVAATRKRAAGDGRSFLLWHAVFWSLSWTGGTLILARRVASWGWHGAGWIAALGAAAVLAGVPVGYRASRRYLERIAGTRAAIERARERRRDIEATQARAEATREAFQQEHARTSAAIKDRQARGEVDAHYVIAAFTAMSHLSDNAGHPPDLAALTERLREMRLKVEAGAPLA